MQLGNDRTAGTGKLKLRLGWQGTLNRPCIRQERNQPEHVFLLTLWELLLSRYVHCNLSVEEDVSTCKYSNCCRVHDETLVSGPQGRQGLIYWPYFASPGVRTTVLAHNLQRRLDQGHFVLLPGWYRLSQKYGCVSKTECTC